jgi:hypothetical protein
MDQTTQPQPTKPEDVTAVDVLLELETTIKSHISGIDKGKSELKKKREMVESALLNDETYRLHNEDAKKAAKIKSKTKKQILDQQQNKQLVADTYELAAEVKEMDVALSDYLREYQRMSGATEIETDDGEVREIVYVAKLVKKSKRAV